MGPLSIGDRADAMRGRVRATAGRAGLSAAGLERLDDAVRAALRPRVERLDNAHPELLHPARTALILLDDLGVTAPDVLIAGVLCETLRPMLAAPSAAFEAASAAVRAILEEVPGAVLPDDLGPAAGPPPRPRSAGPPGTSMPRGDDDLLERLVTASEAAQLVALAEHLDHARHLHFRERSEWEPLHRVTCRTYAPIAHRVDPLLGRRYASWCSAFERRFLSA